jgi:hypothetical protein
MGNIKMYKILTAAAALLLFNATPGKAGYFSFFGDMSGAKESPVNASPGTGHTLITLDTINHQLFVHVDFTGLLGNTTASHVHCCTAIPGVSTVGVATALPSFVGFPLGVTSGSYDHTYDTTLASSFSAAFVTANGGTAAGAETAFLNGMLAGTAYLNVHSTVVPGGEIRSFLQAPEPASMALITVGMAGIAVARRRRRKS